MTIKNAITNNGITSASFNGKNYSRREVNGVVFYDITSSSSGATSGGGANVTTSDTMPASASDGDLWYDETNGGLYVYTDSINGWIQTNGGGGTAGGASVTTGDTAPATPANGDLWFDESVSELYAYIESQDAWIQTNGGGGGSGGSPRAYVTFDGTATDLTASIVNSHNVDSITDGGVGVHTINLTNTLSNGVVLADGFTIWGGPGIAGIPVMDGVEVTGVGDFNGVKLQTYVFGGGVGFTDLVNLSLVVH